MPLAPDAIDSRAGIGLRPRHYREIVAARPDVAFLEIHAENYFAAGGQPLAFLERLRADYPLSVHGVGLSLGSTDALDVAHLEKLARLVDRFQPGLISEHLCWCSVGGRHFNDLLPLPFTDEAAKHVSRRISQAQDYLGRQILIENLSSYLEFADADMAEWEFLSEVARRSGCGILLDVNNVHVSSSNHGFDPHRYLRCLPVEPVKEIHLAGFDDNGQCLIDTHGKPVAEAVWDLYREAVARFGPTPTLIEWDTDVPALAVLVEEARRADAILAEQRHALAA
jgi:uncharacterized protein (UPF0276 family)